MGKLPLGAYSQKFLMKFLQSLPYLQETNLKRLHRSFDKAPQPNNDRKSSQVFGYQAIEIVAYKQRAWGRKNNSSMIQLKIGFTRFS